VNRPGAPNLEANLRDYRRKRDPESTPEPFGADHPRRAVPPGTPLHFVVQQHAATRTHWDLRLEIDGALASWAIPKGPSLDPSDKRLAVRTEDHPMEYADFEGVIPEGNYGAGAMIVWDRGVYRSVDGQTPAEGLAAGKLDLQLDGHKLRGRFALVRTRGADGDDPRQWLLISKNRAAERDEAIVDALPGSVLSGLSVEQLAAGETRDAQLVHHARNTRAPRSDIDAAKLRPMLASTGDRPFSDPRWLFELKYDGVRTLASKHPERGARLYSRQGRDVSYKYPEIVASLEKLPVRECVIDGEIVVLGGDGRPSFERLQRRFTQREVDEIEQVRREHPVVLYAFDLLHAAGHDLRTRPLSLRKQLLALCVPRIGAIRYADHVEGDGEALFAAAEVQGLEGIVAKRADSKYETGRRSERWQKLKVPRSAKLAIVGLVPGKGARKSLGSLMVAWRRGAALVYAGNVGSGLVDDAVEELLVWAETRERREPACEGLPASLPRGVRFVEPERSCEVRFAEVTSAGLLRHPVFAGLCEGGAVDEWTAADSPPATAEDEPAVSGAPPGAEERDLGLTRLDKVFWPIEGFTKGDLLAYYTAAWPFLAPYLRDRPVVLTRYPDGIGGKYFFQKNAPEFTPDWAIRETIDGTDYFVCNDVETLRYVINSGAIPLHVWHARRGSIERPDWLVLDLDPKQAPFEWVVTIARRLHAMLEDLGAPHFVKTSGQDGLHILLPLGGALDHDQSRALAEVLARTVCAELPEIATITRPVAARADRVYVDYLQNGRGKLIASALSVRPRPGAPVSMPLRWSQVTRRLEPTKWNIRTAVRRLERDGDPMLPLFDSAIELEPLLARLEDRLAESEE
jgi:bifunctional non-homologous end joining protein LigD